MSQTYVCAKCGVKAPAVDSSFTLIGAQFGWRVSKTTAPDGSLVVTWHCPGCWKEHKKDSARKLVAAR